MKGAVVTVPFSFACAWGRTPAGAEDEKEDDDVRARGLSGP
jgi:hypothetical protein